MATTIKSRRAIITPSSFLTIYFIFIKEKDDYLKLNEILQKGELK